MAIEKSKQQPDVLVQTKISRRAATLLRKRAKRSVRTQASYLRALIYRDLGLASGWSLKIVADKKQDGE